MSIYDQNNYSIIGNNTPIKYRLPKFLGWMYALLYPIEWLRYNFVNFYRNGHTALNWNNTFPFTVGFYVRGSDKAIYQCFIANTNVNPVGDTTGHWYMACGDFRGSVERQSYTGAIKLSFEYALNRWFGTTFRQPNAVSDIYITNNHVTNVFIASNNPHIASYANNLPQFTVSFCNNAYSFGQSNFVIHVPSSLATALGSQWQQFISSFANKYKLSGTLFSIVQY